MTEEEALLTEEQEQLALDWVRKHWVADQESCEVCKHSDWVLAPYLVALPILMGEHINLRRFYPKFLIMCENCGNTKFFSAIKAGIVPIDLEEEQNAAESA